MDPTFEEFASEGTSPDSSSNETTTTRNSGDNQLFIKGRWGTELKRAGDGCDRCHRNASHVIVARMDDDKGEVRAAINACQKHKDEIARELENQYDCMIVEREY